MQYKARALQTPFKYADCVLRILRSRDYQCSVSTLQHHCLSACCSKAVLHAASLIQHHTGASDSSSQGARSQVALPINRANLLEAFVSSHAYNLVKN